MYNKENVYLLLDGQFKEDFDNHLKRLNSNSFSVYGDLLQIEIIIDFMDSNGIYLEYSREWGNDEFTDEWWFEVYFKRPDFSGVVSGEGFKSRKMVKIGGILKAMEKYNSINK